MIRLFTSLLRKIVGLVMVLLSPFRRAVCRRRKKSESDLSLPVHPLPDSHSTTIDMSSAQTSLHPEVQMESWDSWDMEDISSRMYLSHSNSISHPSTKQGSGPELEPEIEPDYFQDMIPEFKRAKKIMVRRKEDSVVNPAVISHRLAVQAHQPSQMTRELGAWDDDEAEGGTWEVEEEEGLVGEATAALRSKRRLEHQQRNQQRRKQERQKPQLTSHISAVKLS